MEKERIEVVLIPQEEKKDNTLFIYLLGRWKLLCIFLLSGLLIGMVGVFLYYKSTQKPNEQIAGEAPSVIELKNPLDMDFLTTKLQESDYTVLSFPALARGQMAGFEEQAKRILLLHTELFESVNRSELAYEINLSRQSVAGLELMLQSMEEHMDITPGLLQHADKAYLEERIAVNEAVIGNSETFLQTEAGALAYVEIQKALQPVVWETEQYKSILDGTFVDSDPAGTNAMLAQMDIYIRLIDDANEDLLRIYDKYFVEAGRAAAEAAGAAEAAMDIGSSFSKLKAAAIVCLCIAGACILWLIAALVQKEWSRILREGKEERGAAV